MCTPPPPPPTTPSQRNTAALHLATATCLPQPEAAQGAQQDAAAGEVDNGGRVRETCGDERRDDTREAAPEAREAASGTAHGGGKRFGCPAIQHCVERRLDCSGRLCVSGWDYKDWIRVDVQKYSIALNPTLAAGVVIVE